MKSQPIALTHLTWVTRVTLIESVLLRAMHGSKDNKTDLKMNSRQGADTDKDCVPLCWQPRASKTTERNERIESTRLILQLGHTHTYNNNTRAHALSICPCTFKYTNIHAPQYVRTYKKRTATHLRARPSRFSGHLTALSLLFPMHSPRQHSQ